jgi:hypothetical protein
MLSKLPENNSGFLAYRNTAQSMSHGGSSFTDVIYDTEVYDLLGEYNSTTGIFTAKYDGTYACCWSVMSVSTSWTVNELFIACLSINGGFLADGDCIAGLRWEAMESITAYAPSNGSCSIRISAGDTLNVGVYQTQGAAVNLFADGQYNFFSVHKIGP